jgi:hypothetical protein
MAKRGRPAKVKVIEPIAPIVVPVLDMATGKTEFKPLLEKSKPELDALTQHVKAKAEYLTNVNQIQSGMNGLTANGDLKFGNPLDGFTPEAIAQLKTMSTHELGSPKVAELFQEQTTPAQAPQIILPTSYNNTVQAAPQQAQTQQAPKIDVMDIFGIK